MNELTHQNGNISERALATAQWAKPEDVESLIHQPGALWLGRAVNQNETSVGFQDDRHALIVAGNRSGKGTSAIVPNLCLWPGSVVVIDPKGENATITATRRAEGSEYCEGLDQQTFVLDPFKAAKVPEELRASFNPIEALDPDDEESVDDAARIADALVISENTNDSFWDEQARTLIKGLILHVLTDKHFEGKRNLVTVRHLITSGDVESRKTLEDMGEDYIPTAMQFLFQGMRRNEAFGGIIAGTGEAFSSMAANSQKTLNSVLSAAGNHTEFIDSLPMKRQLSESARGLKLSQLKTDPMGISIFLSLPQRFMNTHFRWLRMMVALTITEMEKVPGQPKSEHRVLMILDEFAGLKKMEVIENAAAQIAGFGVKMCFIVQQLTQLKTVYKDNWEIFVGNSGTKIFFGIEDKFTREYISKYLGESEVIRTTTNQSQTDGTSRSSTHGSSSSSSSSISNTLGESSGSSYNVGSGTTSSTGSSFSYSSNSSSSSSSSHSVTAGENESKTAGTGEGIHKRALLTPDEIGMAFSRIEDKNNPAYPGLALAIASGKKPIVVRRTNYFDDLAFERKFDPHPDHEFKKIEPKQQKIEVIPPKLLDEELIEKYGNENYKKACTVYQKVKQDFPRLKILKCREDEFVKHTLLNAQRAIDTSAADGRVHTMVETLDILKSTLGGYFVKNPNFQLNQKMDIVYGDEQNGNAATRKYEKKKLRKKITLITLRSCAVTGVVLLHIWLYHELRFIFWIVTVFSGWVILSELFK